LLLLKRARKVGLLAYWNMLHTIPGERDESYAEMAELIPLVTHLQAPFGVAQIHYDRFSPYWRDPQAHGLELMPAFGYQYVYPFAQDVLKDVAYFFDAPYQRESFQRVDPRKRGGLLKLLKAVFDWRNSWWRSHKAMPTLQATDAGDRLRFEDTRPVAIAPTFEIAGLERRIYLLAEDGMTPNNLLIKLQAEDGGAFDPDRVEAALQALLDKRVVALVSGRVLALGIATPIAPYLAHNIDLDRKDMDLRWARLEADKALDLRRPNIALDCLRQPGSESLDDWLAPSRVGAALGAGAK
jgi:magnesium-protoporphyrin IX monomethyl ester (oxidative) cyclase